MHCPNRLVDTLIEFLHAIIIRTDPDKFQVYFASKVIQGLNTYFRNLNTFDID